MAPEMFSYIENLSGGYLLPYILTMVNIITVTIKHPCAFRDKINVF